MVNASLISKRERQLLKSNIVSSIFRAHTLRECQQERSLTSYSLVLTASSGEGISKPSSDSEDFLAILHWRRIKTLNRWLSEFYEIRSDWKNKQQVWVVLSVRRIEVISTSLHQIGHGVSDKFRVVVVKSVETEEEKFKHIESQCSWQGEIKWYSAISCWLPDAKRSMLIDLQVIDIKPSRHFSSLN